MLKEDPAGSVLEVGSGLFVDIPHADGPMSDFAVVLRIESAFTKSMLASIHRKMAKRLTGRRERMLRGLR